jgi:hypothetical protein
VAFGRGPLAGKHYQPPQLALDFSCSIPENQGRRGF